MHNCISGLHFEDVFREYAFNCKRTISMLKDFCCSIPMYPFPYPDLSPTGICIQYAHIIRISTCTQSTSSPNLHSQLRLTIISNTLNLHRHPLGQLLHCHTRPRGLVRKELLIYAVHLSEVRHVVQKDIDLDDLCDVRAGFLEDGDDVIAAGGCFIGDGAFNEVALVVGRDLAGDVDLGSCDYGLGLEVC